MVNDSEPPAEERSAMWDGEERFDAIVESHEMHPDECTIFPADAGEMERMSTWITAREPSFVSLEDLR